MISGYEGSKPRQVLISTADLPRDPRRRRWRRAAHATEDTEARDRARAAQPAGGAGRRPYAQYWAPMSPYDQQPGPASATPCKRRARRLEIDISEVEERTKIRISYLRAIERRTGRSCPRLPTRAASCAPTRRSSGSTPRRSPTSTAAATRSRRRGPATRSASPCCAARRAPARSGRRSRGGRSSRRAGVLDPGRCPRGARPDADGDDGRRRHQAKQASTPSSKAKEEARQAASRPDGAGGAAARAQRRRLTVCLVGRRGRGAPDRQASAGRRRRREQFTATSATGFDLRFGAARRRAADRWSVDDEEALTDRSGLASLRGSTQDGTSSRSTYPGRDCP